MLSEALRLLRVFHDLKQNELARRLGLSKSYISEIENGNRTPSLDVIQKYSDEFKIPTSSILFFSENLAPDSGSAASSERIRQAISKKIITFLQLIEAKTESNGTKI